MTFPTDDIVSADGALNRAVLLSERSQLIAIKALQVAENRANWEEMSDSNWDTLEDYVANALTEILTIQGTGMIGILREYRRNTNQAISASTNTAIIWNDGHASSPTDTMLSPVNGIAIITAWIQYFSESVGQLTAWISINGNEYGRQDSDANRTSHMRQLSFAVNVLEQDEIKIIVRAQTAGSIIQNNGPTRIHVAFLENQ